MGPVGYRVVLRAVLDSVSQVTAARLSAIHRAATAGADGVLIEVFLEQDAEGPFGVEEQYRYDGDHGPARPTGPSPTRHEHVRRCDLQSAAPVRPSRVVAVA